MTQRYMIILGAAVLLAAGLTLFGGTKSPVSGPEVESAPTEQPAPVN